MHKKEPVRIIAVWIAIISLASCTVTSQQINPDRMYESASALTKLSAAMESYTRFGKPGADLSEAELLANGTEHDPALLSKLNGYKVRVLNRDRHAVVLICAKEGNQALLEDAGCTGTMDVHHWNAAPRACSFTIQAALLCPASGTSRP